MSEQTPAAEVQPTGDSPTGAASEESVNYQERYHELEKRFNDTQAWGHTQAQENAALREKAQLIDDWNSGDPEAQRRAAEALQIQLEEEEADQTQYASVDPKILQRLEAFEQSQVQQQQSQVEQQQHAAYRSDVDPQLTTMGVPDGFHDAVAETALGLPGLQTVNGLKPDLEGAWAQVKEFILLGVELPDVQTAVKKTWQRTKPTAAVTQAGGVQATHTPPLETRAQKADWIAQQLSQLDDDDAAVR
jgi:hypothetical protein